MRISNFDDSVPKRFGMAPLLCQSLTWDHSFGLLWWISNFFFWCNKPVITAQSHCQSKTPTIVPTILPDTSSRANSHWLTSEQRRTTYTQLIEVCSKGELMDTSNYLEILPNWIEDWEPSWQTLWCFDFCVRKFRCQASQAFWGDCWPIYSVVFHMPIYLEFWAGRNAWRISWKFFGNA